MNTSETITEETSETPFLKFISNSIGLVNSGYNDINPRESPFADPWESLLDGKVLIAVVNFSSILTQMDSVLFAKTIRGNLEHIAEMIESNDVNTRASNTIKIITSFYVIIKYLNLIEKHEPDFKKKIDECDSVITVCDTNEIDSKDLTEFKEMVEELKNYKNNIMDSYDYSGGVYSTLDLINDFINPRMEELRQSMGDIVSSV